MLTTLAFLGVPFSLSEACKCVCFGEIESEDMTLMMLIDKKTQTRQSKDHAPGPGKAQGESQLWDQVMKKRARLGGLDEAHGGLKISSLVEDQQSQP